MKNETIDRFLESVLKILFVCFVCVFFLRPIETEDVWWHLATGKFIASHFQVPHTDPFSFTTEPIPWTFTQWLGSTIYYLIYSVCGLTGLRLSRVAIFLLIFAIFYIYSSRKIGNTLSIALMVLMSFGLGLRSQLRPEAFNFIFIQLLLIILLTFEKNRNKKLLWLIPILGIAWSNIHLGSFVYAGIILFCYFVKFFTEHFSRKENSNNDLYAFIFCAIGYFLCFAINPYGVSALIYPFRVFLDPQFISLYKFNSFIIEQQPPVYWLFNISGVWFYGLSIGFIYSYFRNKNRDLVTLLLFVFGFFLFLYSQRGSAFFVLISGYLIIKNLSQIQDDLKIKYFLSGHSKKVIQFILILFLLFQIARITGRKYYHDGQTGRVIFKKESFFTPTHALNFLSENNIKGTIFNFDKFGGYLLLYGFPDIKPLVDGRQLNLSAWQAYNLIVSDPAMFWRSYEEKYDFQAALIDAKKSFSHKLMKYLLNDSLWELNDIDGSVVLFTKKMNNPGEKSFLESLDYREYDPIIYNRILSAQFNNRGFLHGFKPGVYYFNDEVEEAVTLYDLGMKMPAINKMINAFTINPNPYDQKIIQLMVEQLNVKEGESK